MKPRSDLVDYNVKAGAEADELISAVDVPPAWSNALRWIPLLGNYLNVAVQMGDYATTLEQCADFMARDLDSGLESELIGHRVSIKAKSKSA